MIPLEEILKEFRKEFLTIQFGIAPEGVEDFIRTQFPLYAAKEYERGKKEKTIGGATVVKSLIEAAHAEGFDHGVMAVREIFEKKVENLEELVEMKFDKPTK